jgi:hypothetical protein
MKTNFHFPFPIPVYSKQNEKLPFSASFLFRVCVGEGGVGVYVCI